MREYKNFFWKGYFLFSKLGKFHFSKYKKNVRIESSISEINEIFSGWFFLELGLKRTLESPTIHYVNKGYFCNYLKLKHYYLRIYLTSSFTATKAWKKKYYYRVYSKYCPITKDRNIWYITLYFMRRTNIKAFCYKIISNSHGCHFCYIFCFNPTTRELRLMVSIAIFEFFQKSDSHDFDFCWFLSLEDRYKLIFFLYAKI